MSIILFFQIQTPPLSILPLDSESPLHDFFTTAPNHTASPSGPSNGPIPTTTTTTLCPWNSAKTTTIILPIPLTSPNPFLYDKPKNHSQMSLHRFAACVPPKGVLSTRTGFSQPNVCALTHWPWRRNTLQNWLLAV